jgi:metal-dependent amidase/aminoacylase/carboxypeptidase family protein
MAFEELKAKVFAAIDANADKIINIGDTIWKNPEPGYREFKTAALAADVMRSLGLSPREKLGITGVRGDMTFSEDAPAIAILGEMDSLILPNHPECDPHESKYSKHDECSHKLKPSPVEETEHQHTDSTCHKIHDEELHSVRCKNKHWKE